MRNRELIATCAARPTRGRHPRSDTLAADDSSAPARSPLGPLRRRLRFLRPDDRRTGGHAAEQARPGPRATPPPRRQRLLGSRTRDRYRGAPLRRAPVPHLQPAGVGLRAPVHRVHRLPAPGVRPLQRPGLPVPDGAGAGQSVLRPLFHARRGAGVDPRAGQRDPDRGRAEPGGEGDLADRPPALRGVRQALHRQAVADRSQGAARLQHHQAAGALHVRQPLLQRHLRGAAGRRVHRLAAEHGRRRAHRGAVRHRLVRRARPAAGRQPRRAGDLHRPPGPLLRLRRRPAGVAHAGLRARGAADG